MQDIIDKLINGPARYTQANNLSDGWALLVILGALLVEICLIIYLVRLLFAIVVNIPSLLSFLLRLFGVARRDESYVFMQLTFPAEFSSRLSFQAVGLYALKLCIFKLYFVYELEKYGARI